MKTTVVLLTLAGFLATGVHAQTAPFEPEPGTEVLWDSYGVPHVFAKDARSLLYAFGWAQMQSHGDLILRLYAQARGRAAEYWGAEFVESDRWMLLNDVPARAAEWYDETRPTYRAMLDAFVDGINAYATEHRDSFDDRVKLVLPIESTDVLAHIQRVLHFTFIARREEVMVGVREARSPAGSNAWAISPRRSASGKTLLLANPHLPWGDLYTFYEAQLVAPGLNAYGVALLGFPLLSIAFNERLGWTHTVNTYDGADLYELTLVDDGYAWNGGVRSFEVEHRELRVRQPDNTVSVESVDVRRSIHGPVVRQEGNRAVALRVAGLDAPHLLEQNWLMLRARNRDEFERALRMLQLPMFTVMYADRNGQIMHVFNGRVPKRPRGNWLDWRGIMRGDTSATLWTAIHPYRDLPRVVNPSSGWLQNANDAPWTTTFPLALRPDRFPDYMAPPLAALAFRPQRSIRMLMADSSITFEELIAYKHSTRLEAADHLIEELRAAVEAHGTDRAKRAIAVLTEWDRNADADSRGAVLFDAIMREAGRQRWPGGSIFAVRWSAARPLDTPRGLSDAVLAATVVDVAAAAVEQRYGALTVSWGSIYRLRAPGIDLPANGAPGALGAFRVTEYQPAPDGTFTAVFGDTYIAAIEFSNPVRAMTLLSYGNASRQGAVQGGEQLQLYAEKTLKTAWLTRAEIERHLARRELLGKQ